jgi:transcription factor MBP1
MKKCKVVMESIKEHGFPFTKAVFWQSETVFSINFFPSSTMYQEIEAHRQLQSMLLLRPTRQSNRDKACKRRLRMVSFMPCVYAVLMFVANNATETTYEMATMTHYVDDHTPDEASISESIMDDADSMMAPFSNSRKRKREEEEIASMQDAQHQIWADALLDYFMLADSEDRFPAPPVPPPGLNLDRPIDDKGHSALHWAAAMGDLDVVTDLLRRGAHIDTVSTNLETPLMRAVMFTNNYDKDTMRKLIQLMSSIVHKTDWFGSTVFHHIAATTSSKNKYLSARYYMDTIINALAETWVPDQITSLLNARDRNGDTAIHIAARHGARKCVRSLLGRNVALDIPNNKGETADEMIQELNARRRLHAANTQGRHASSSPFGPDRAPLNGDSISAITAVGSISMGPPAAPQYHSQTASSVTNRLMPSFTSKLRALASAYETEFEEKQAEAIENEHLVRKRQAELEALSKQSDEAQIQLDEIFAHELASQGISSLEDEKRAEEEELQHLEREALSLLEFEQRDRLTRSTVAVPKDMTNGSMSGGDDAKLAITQKLTAAQDDRRRLTGDIVRSLSTAGLSEKQAEYKRLIHGALGVKESELEGMLDEMLGQLEEDKREMVLMEDVS